MQQLCLTLIALLGIFVPTANTRIAKFFLRFVPPMSSGRVACDMGGDADNGTLSGKAQGILGSDHDAAPQRGWVVDALLNFMKEGEQQLKRGRPDSLQRRIRRAQRAAGSRSGYAHHNLIPTRCGDFF